MKSLLSSIKRCGVRLTSEYLRVAALIAILFGLFSPTAKAQEATIVGTVTDPSGAVIAGVAVRIANEQTGATRTLSTNRVGQYVSPALPIGTYNLRAEATGFKPAESKNVVLNTNDRVRVDFQMRLGSHSDTAVIESTAVSVQADSGEQSSLLSGTQMSELSTNGRSIYSYAALAPGAANLIPGFQPPSPIGTASNLSFDGNRPGHNLFLLDGGENYDRGGGGSSIIAPSVDAIAEMQTLTSNYSAESGLSSAGTVSSVLKSGTRTVHFSLWEFLRNDALDARNFFNPAPQPVAELRYNLYGFNVGGPVTLGGWYNPSKTRTFFFYNMEWRKLIQGQILNQVVPLPSTYGGNFSASGLSLDQFHAPAVCQVSPAIQARFLAANQPLSGCANGFPDPAQEVAFNNNAIPASLLDTNAQVLLKAGGKYGGIFPAPNSGSSFVGGNKLPTNVREEIVRIDENFSPKLSVFGHLVAEQNSQDYGTTIFSGDNVPTIGNKFLSPTYAAVIHATYIFSPSVVNEASFSYNGNRIDLLPLGLFSAPSDFTFRRSTSQAARALFTAARFCPGTTSPTAIRGATTFPGRKGATS
jgi:Carboxypeptidase regulatory-like domain